MLTKMFVFIGMPIKKNVPTIAELQDKLKIEFSSSNYSLQFSLKDQLITARNNNVSYYISILGSKKELKDWIQLAKDSELSADLTSLTENVIIDRYNKIRIKQPAYTQKQNIQLQ